MTNKEKLAHTLLSLGEIYGRKVSKNTIDIYYNCVKHIAIEDVVDALSAHLMEPDRCRFFPMPGDIIGKLEKSDQQIQAEVDAEMDELAIKPKCQFTYAQIDGFKRTEGRKRKDAARASRSHKGENLLTINPVLNLVDNDGR